MRAARLDAIAPATSRRGGTPTDAASITPAWSLKSRPSGDASVSGTPHLECRNTLEPQNIVEAAESRVIMNEASGAPGAREEPPQRAPERSAPDASRSRWAPARKSGGPVWIGLARAGRTWHPATARIRPDPARVGRPRERDRLPLQAPDGSAAITLDQPPGGARTYPRMAPGRSPTHLSGGAAGCGAARCPLSDPPAAQPRKARSGPTGRQVVRRMACQPVPADRSKRHEPTPTVPPAPDDGTRAWTRPRPADLKDQRTRPFAAAAACPNRDSLRKPGRAERASAGSQSDAYAYHGYLERTRSVAIRKFGSRENSVSNFRGRAQSLHILSPVRSTGICHQYAATKFIRLVSCREVNRLGRSRASWHGTLSCCAAMAALTWRRRAV